MHLKEIKWNIGSKTEKSSKNLHVIWSSETKDQFLIFFFSPFWLKTWEASCIFIKTGALANSDYLEKAKSFKENITLFLWFKEWCLCLSFICGRVNEILTAIWSFPFRHSVHLICYVQEIRSQLFQFQLLTDAQE